MNPKGLIGTVVLALLILTAILAPVISPYDPNEIHLRETLQPPSRDYWFGTDELGRDIFSRILHGAGMSLQAGLLATLMAAIAGVVLGLLAGYLGGWIDAVIMRICDTAMAFPGMFLAIVVVAILGPGRWPAIVAIAVMGVPGFARLTRGTAISIKEEEFVLGAHAVGASAARIMRLHILPNCLAPLTIQMALSAPGAIIVEAGLSYLGLGSQPPQPSWGNMLQIAQSYLYAAPTYGIFPGIAITLVVLGMNFFADGFQDAVDPRRTRVRAKKTFISHLIGKLWPKKKKDTSSNP